MSQTTQPAPQHRRLGTDRVVALAALTTIAMVAVVGAVGPRQEAAVAAPAPASATATASPDSPPREPVPVQVNDPLLVVNKDGSAAVAASLQNPNDVELALVDVRVEIDGQALPVSSTIMWLPLPPDMSSQVGAASDAGGFMVPNGVLPGSQARLTFRFDDGMCVDAIVRAVARSGEHRLIYPRSGRLLSPDAPATPRQDAGACQ